MPFDEQRLLETPSGAALNLFVKNACQKARAVVQINHGLSEHAGSYAAFADFLAGRGFHVYAQDHRGHGGTKAEDTLPGMFARRDGVKKIIADVASVHDLIAREHPGLPVILFGQSMGGVVALSFLRQRARPVAGAAVWNYPETSRLSAHAARLLLAWERFRLGSDAPSHLLPRFMMDASQADPSCGWPPTISLWSDLFAMMVELSKPGVFAQISRSLPLHLATCGADPITGSDITCGMPPTPSPSPQGGGRRRHRFSSRNRRDLALCRDVASFPSPLRGGVRGGGHPIFDQPAPRGEYPTICYAKAMQDFAAWIDHAALDG